MSDRFTSGSPGQGTPLACYRSIFGVDIERYSDRPNTVKGRLRAQLDRLITETISVAGIGPRQYDAPADQGDGLLVLFGAEVPKNLLLHPLVPRLAARLVDYNAGVPDRERLRLRVVVAAGDLCRDDRAYFGAALDDAFGLGGSVCDQRVDVVGDRRRVGDDPGALLTDDGLERGTVGPDFEAALIETGEPLRFGSIPGRPHLLVLMSSGFRPEP